MGKGVSPKAYMWLDTLPVKVTLNDFFSMWWFQGYWKVAGKRNWLSINDKLTKTNKCSQLAQPQSSISGLFHVSKPVCY